MIHSPGEQQEEVHMGFAGLGPPSPWAVHALLLPRGPQRAARSAPHAGPVAPAAAVKISGQCSQSAAGRRRSRTKERRQRGRTRPAQGQRRGVRHVAPPCWDPFPPPPDPLRRPLSHLIHKMTSGYSWEA